MKLIFITGSLSGLGKGTIAASIGAILQAYGFDVTIAKIDPYINIDAGLMNPHEHGEVFVLEEIWEFRPVDDFIYTICEVDQDFGTYERFLHKNLHPSQNITSGQIYLSVILKERKGKYLGKTVQLIPHVAGEIKDRIISIAEKHDITIIEVGGTVGDYEAAIFLEAIRQLRNELPWKDSLLIHVVWIPYLKPLGEYKTKPAQQSFRLLLESGLQCDMLIARLESGRLTSSAKAKLSLYSNVPNSAIFEVPNLEIPYETLLLLHNQGIDKQILDRLGLNPNGEPSRVLNMWEDFIRRIRSASSILNIGLVGKYTRMKDTYISIIEALRHAGAYLGVRPIVRLVDSERIGVENLKSFDGLILTPGFGKRGTEGMIRSAIFSMRERIPFLGICFGAQLATVAFAREVMGWHTANSTEIDPNTEYPVVDLLPEQKKIVGLGGTMRLGGLEIKVLDGTKLLRIYGTNKVRERFRHRYHIMWDYVQKMSAFGFRVDAVDIYGRIAAFELDNHPFFIGVQYHPEYKSRPLSPHPIFIGFMEACMNLKNSSSK